MMNTIKHLQYQEAKEFQGEQTSRFVGLYTFILMSFHRAGLMCGLKQGKFELTIVFFSFFFLLYLLAFPKICLVSKKSFGNLKNVWSKTFLPINHLYCRISFLRILDKKGQNSKLKIQTIYALSSSAKLTTLWEGWKKRRRWAIYYLRISN